MRNYLDFLLAMTTKEIKARYKNAVLGFMWILLNPLLQMLIIGLVFQNLIKTPINNYFLFLFPGLLLWNFFSYSLTKATSSIVYERDLIQKAKFPREAIPLSIIFSNFFNLLISLFLFIVYLFITNNFKILISPLSWAYLFLSLLWILSFTCGASILSSSLNVKYRDISFFIQALCVLWFYATPVIYSLEILPRNYFSFFRLNPLAYPFEMIRSSLISTPLPSNDILIANLSISLLIICLGIFIFRKESRYFSDWL